MIKYYTMRGREVKAGWVSARTGKISRFYRLDSQRFNIFFVAIL